MFRIMMFPPISGHYFAGFNPEMKPSTCKMEICFIRNILPFGPIGIVSFQKIGVLYIVVAFVPGGGKFEANVNLFLGQAKSRSDCKSNPTRFS
jgi:hypothetical protein